MPRLLLVVAVGLGIALFATSADPPTAPAPRPIPVGEWVGQLGVGPVAQREEAERRLSALAVDPPPELLAALKSSSVDARDRARRIVQAMRWNVAATKLPRGQKFAERGQVDLFVAATAAWDLNPDDDRLWEPPVDLGRVLIAKAGLKGDRKPHNCPSSFKDYVTYKRLMPPLFKRLDEPYYRLDPAQATPPILYHQEAVQAPGLVTAKGISCNLVVSRGDVRAETVIQSSVVLANGDVTSRGTMVSSVIVCDGDVAVLDRNINQSLVVARGSITVKGSASAATLIAGGKVTIQAQRKLIDENDYNVIKENESNPLGFVTFFELSRVGLEVKAADKTVQVAKVAAGSASEKAGLKAGDTVLDVGGKKPADAEALRRLLRDALAVGDAAMKVKRGGETITVKLALQE